jgi:hypothetical protein
VSDLKLTPFFVDIDTCTHTLGMRSRSEKQRKHVCSAHWEPHSWRFEKVKVKIMHNGLPVSARHLSSHTSAT